MKLTKVSKKKTYLEN